MGQDQRPIALITGGSRGVGAATALALAERGYDIIITYRNKRTRAAEVSAAVEGRGASALTIGGDLTKLEDVERLVTEIRAWAGRLNLLVLNASGGLERDLVAADPDYPMRINRDAQLAVLDACLPLFQGDGAVVFVTSHWAHRYGRVEQLPAYEPIAASKHAGEQALRARQADLADRGIRLIVVTGDLIDGTITAKLLERGAPGLAASRRDENGQLSTTSDMGEAIADAATDSSLPSGHTLVVGGALDSLPTSPSSC